MAIDRKKRGPVTNSKEIEMGIIEAVKESERTVMTKRVNLGNGYAQLLEDKNCVKSKAFETDREER